MDKKVIFITRYSLLLDGSSGWVLSRNSDSIEDYKAKLFDSVRLSSHYHIFKNLTFPSVLGQADYSSSVKIEWVILVSEELPEEHLSELFSLVEGYEFIKIRRVGRSFSSDGYELLLDEVMSGAQTSTLVATVRLDDDDAISSDYLSQLESYMDIKYAGFAISFGMGLSALYSSENKKIDDIREYYYPKIAIGLAYLNVYCPVSKVFHHLPHNVYKLGKHSQCDRRCPVIIDSRKVSFIRTIHRSSDTYEDWIKKIKKMPQGNKKNLERFAISPGFLELTSFCSVGVK